MAPLTDEDRGAIVRWIDLGCPIDFNYDPAQPERRGFGFACDNQRPTLTLTYAHAGANPGAPGLTRLLGHKRSMEAICKNILGKKDEDEKINGLT